MKTRPNINNFNQIPNVGSATVKYFHILGLSKPFELVGKNPYSLFEELCERTGKQFDPCLADIFISAVKYMEGAPAQKWWYYTEERKIKFAEKRNK